PMASGPRFEDPDRLSTVLGPWNLIRRTAEDWRRRMETSKYATILELAEAVGLAERHVSRQLRLANLAPHVLKRLTCGREASTVSLYDLCFVAGEAWGEQVGRTFD
ncbi:hypothetical protein, partial [Yoonia sp.]|uniref:hypothetical protein n=1 Tax=Yoonia sp. TaxID=2212373 RepID=UPI004047856D